MVILQLRAARFVIVFFLSIAPEVSPTAAIAVRVFMMFHIIKDPVAVQTCHIKLPRVTVRCYNQGFLIPYTRSDIYKHSCSQTQSDYGTIFW